jgi:hypothetical protein
MTFVFSNYNINLLALNHLFKSTDTSSLYIYMDIMTQLPAEKSTVGQWSLVLMEEVSLSVVDTSQDSFARHFFVHDIVMLE